MSNTIMSTINTMGVKRLQTLGGLGTAPDQSAIDDLRRNGYDDGTVQTLIALGASNEQLQALPFPADAGSRSAAVQQLMNALTTGYQGPAMQTNTAGSIYGAVSGAVDTVISTAIGTYDLAAQSSWDAISNKFTETQRNLNALAARSPRDPEIIQMVTDFNSLVVQWAGYYQQAVGSAPDYLPMASIPSGLSGLGAIPIAVPIIVVAAVAALLGSLYLLKQKIALKAQAQQASNQAAIIKAYPNATPAQMANLLTPTMTAAQLQAAPTSLVAWFQGNVGYIFGGLVATVVILKLIKKI